jgi:MurNAc alpha-1-phosphate uridylyltransferase
MKAMILAAGRGERMRPLTDDCPKPLLPAGGKPLIVWHIERLARMGFYDIVINHAHLGQMIETALGDGRHWGVRLHYSAEQTALETAGGIANALSWLGQEPFLVVNGDIFCDYDFALMREHAAKLHPGGLLAHLVLVPNPEHHPQGDFALRNDAVVEGEPSFTFSGIGVYHPSLFSSIVPGQAAKLAPLLNQAIGSGHVRGEFYSGLWQDIGTPARLAELDRLLQKRCSSPNPASL